MKTRILVAFLFLCQSILGFLFIPLIPLHAAISGPEPLFDIIIKKKEEVDGKTNYSLLCEGSDLECDARTLHLRIEGDIKKEPELSIVEIDQGRIGFDGFDPAVFDAYLIYKNKLLTFSYLKTRSFILSGTVDLAKSSALDLTIDIKGMSLKSFNKLWGIENFPFQGDFRGKISLKGTLANIFVEGSLEAYKGTLEDYSFEKVFLSFRGTYPWVELSRSFAVIEGHTVEIEGALNLAKLYTPPCLNIVKAVAKNEPEKERSQLFRDDAKKEEAFVKDTVRGFLTLSGESNVLLYKLGSDSYIRLRITDALPNLEPKLKF